MKTTNLHDWNLPYAQARALQSELASQIKFTPVKKPPRIVAGLDCAFSRSGETIFAGVVVLQLPDFTVLETAFASEPVTFPYIPGLLSFREAPACISAIHKLRHEPDLFIVDGQGIAHPRRLGLAAHLGLFVDKPFIGCAKSRLTGDYNEPGQEKGSVSPLTDYKTSEIIGSVVRTRTNVKPVFISVGNNCTLDDAVRLTLRCTTKYRLPEPTRSAHNFIGKTSKAPRPG